MKKEIKAKVTARAFDHNDFNTSAQGNGIGCE